MKVHYKKNFFNKEGIISFVNNVKVRLISFLDTEHRTQKMVITK